MTCGMMKATMSNGQVCPDKWIKREQTCYYINLNDKVDYLTASLLCIQDNAHLVFIDSDSIQQWMESVLPSANIYGRNDLHRSAVWIGGVYIQSRWQWVDGRSNHTTQIEYNNWSPYYFTNNGDGSTRCSALVGSDNYNWVDFICDSKFYYICERSIYDHSLVHTGLTSITPSTSLPPTHPLFVDGCPPDWVRNHSSCYFIHLLGYYTHKEAKNRCARHNSHLVFINSPHEQTFLSIYIQGLHLQDASLWIGGIYVGNAWHWEDAYHLTGMKFTNWVPHTSHGKCATMDGINNFKWSPALCSERHMYICERIIRDAPLIG